MGRPAANRLWYRRMHLYCSSRPTLSKNRARGANAASLELQHARGDGPLWSPLFRASPSSSHKMWRLTTPAIPIPKPQTGPGPGPASPPHLNIRAPTRFTAGVWGWRHASADIRSSTGLAPRRGTDCVLCTTRGGRALAVLGQIGNEF